MTHLDGGYQKNKAYWPRQPDREHAQKAGDHYILFKVTVQFETEGYGQNEISSHMDRSEVKL